MKKKVNQKKGFRSSLIYFLMLFALFFSPRILLTKPLSTIEMRQALASNQERVASEALSSLLKALQKAGKNVFLRTPEELERIPSVVNSLYQELMDFAIKRREEIHKELNTRINPEKLDAAINMRLEEDIIHGRISTQEIRPGNRTYARIVGVRNGNNKIVTFVKVVIDDKLAFIFLDDSLRKNPKIVKLIAKETISLV